MEYRKTTAYLVLIVILLLAFVTGCNNTPGEEEIQNGSYNIVLLMGQSNADGFSYYSHLPVYLYYKYYYANSSVKIAYQTTKTSSGNKFVPVRIGQGGDIEFSGSEIGMAEELEANNVPAFIIKWSCWASSLDTDWLKSYGNQKSLYVQAIEYVKDRLNWLINHGVEIENICVCWMQGEADENEIIGPKYEDNLETFVEKLKSDLGGYCNNNFYFIDACLQEPWGTLGLVNSAKENFASKHSDFVSLIPRDPVLITHSIEKTANSWGGSEDGFHFDMQGEYNLGREFIRRFLRFI